jgi:hypothetical protein
MRLLTTSLPNQLRRYAAVWLAVLITVFGALAPTVSHALVWSQGGNGEWTEICISTGIQIQTDSPDGPESVLLPDHCPFCLLFTDRVAPPRHVSVHLFAVSGGFKVPTVRQAFFIITPFALTPLPRGPPAFFELLNSWRLWQTKRLPCAQLADKKE